MVTAKGFQRWFGWGLPYLATLSVLVTVFGLYLVFFKAPLDYQQKETVRIMFVHVPSAWLALGIYAGMGLLNLMGFVVRSPLLFLSARAIAPVGFIFTLICIATGMLWGKPMWGAWWVWDARLTSVAILGLLYAAYMLLTQTYGTNEASLKVGAVISLIGCANLPIIKFSVNWWNTLHQGASVLRIDGPSIHPSMLVPLLVMAGALSLWAFTLSCLRIQGFLWDQRLQSKRLRDVINAVQKGAA